MRSARALRHLLLLSFDYFRPGEPQVSYPLASLSTAVLSDPELWRDWAVDVVSIDLNREVPWSARGLASLLSQKARFDRYDVVAFGDYCWSSRFVPDLLAVVGEWQPHAHLVAGGYQVTSTRSEELVRHYPEAIGTPITFLKGFAETSLRTVLRSLSEGGLPPRELEEPIECQALPSPWVHGEIALGGVEKVRWETKRGCTYACDYCEFKAAMNRPRTPGGMMLARDRLLEELELFQSRGVRKVNVLDPLFNIDGTYEQVLEPMLKSGLSFTLQTRVEDLERQPALIEAAKGNHRLHLEIGVQTLDDELNRLLCRRNQKDRILSTLNLLRRERVSFETNLIFGIPGQTAASHLEDIEALMIAGCEKDAIRCFPLRIPRGSRLEKGRAERHVEEAPYGAGDKLVVAADGFDRLDWLRMLLISEADASYVARAKRMLGADEADPIAWRTKRSWLVDGAVWADVLGRHDYRFRVMVVEGDETLRAHGEFDALEFVDAPGGRAPKLAPGLYWALSWIGDLGEKSSKRPGPFSHIMLDRSRWGLQIQVPARIVRHAIDVSNRVLELWVTWKVGLGEAFSIVRARRNRRLVSLPRR